MRKCNQCKSKNSMIEVKILIIARSDVFLQMESRFCQGRDNSSHDTKLLVIGTALKHCSHEAKGLFHQSTSPPTL